MAESFFATLEVELIDRSDWSGPAEARAAVFEYIEVFYNRIRRHSAIGYLSPAEFERRYRSDHRCLTADRPRKRGTSPATVAADKAVMSLQLVQTVLATGSHVVG